MERIDFGGPINQQPSNRKIWPYPGSFQPGPSESSSIDFQRAGDQSMQENTYESWFTQTEKEEESWLDNLWDWTTSDTGLKTLGGVASGAMGMYAQGRRADALSDTAAELRDERIRVHNESINKPMDMGMRVLKR